MNAFPKLFSRKFIAALVALLFTAQNIVFANKAQTSVWEERRGAQRQNESVASSAAGSDSVLASLPRMETGLALPFTGKALSTMGIAVDVSADSRLKSSAALVPAWMQTAIAPYATIHDIVPGTDAKKPLVLLLQDAHLLYEAQSNIAGSIDALARAVPAGNRELLVGLEGVDLPRADFRTYNAYPHRLALRAAAEALLKANVLNGVEFAAIGFTGEREVGAVRPPFAVTGVEKHSEYMANVHALRDGDEKKEDADDALAALDAALAEIKSERFSKEQRIFDEKKNAYEEGRLSVPDYVVYLDSIRPATTPNARVLIAAALLEGSINFEKVERERSKMLERLVASMSEGDTQELLRISMLYRARQMSYTGYYTYLKNVAARHGIRFSDYPEMNLYVQYVLKSESIDAALLFEEIKRLEENAATALFVHPAELEVARLAGDYHLLVKLSGRTLTEPEWNTYLSRQQEIRAIGDRLASLGRAVPPAVTRAADAWPALENFYRAAIARNKTMAGRMAARLTASGAPMGVLVAGGFHTAGLMAELKDRGFTVLTASPKITEITEGLTSLDILSSNRLPLDRLFAGERLFLTVAAGAIGGLGERMRLRIQNTLLAMAEAVRRANAGETVAVGPEWAMVAADGTIVPARSSLLDVDGLRIAVGERTPSIGDQMIGALRAVLQLPRRAAAWIAARYSAVRRRPGRLASTVFRLTLILSAVPAVATIATLIGCVPPVDVVDNTYAEPGQGNLVPRDFQYGKAPLDVNYPMVINEAAFDPKTGVIPITVNFTNPFLEQFGTLTLIPDAQALTGLFSQGGSIRMGVRGTVGNLWFVVTDATTNSIPSHKIEIKLAGLTNPLPKDHFLPIDFDADFNPDNNTVTINGRLFQLNTIRFGLLVKEKESNTLPTISGGTIEWDVIDPASQNQPELPSDDPPVQLPAAAYRPGALTLAAGDSLILNGFVNDIRLDEKNQIVATVQVGDLNYGPMGGRVTGGSLKSLFDKQAAAGLPQQLTVLFRGTVNQIDSFVIAKENSPDPNAPISFQSETALAGINPNGYVSYTVTREQLVAAGINPQVGDVYAIVANISQLGLGDRLEGTLTMAVLAEPGQTPPDETPTATASAVTLREGELELTTRQPNVILGGYVRTVNFIGQGIMQFTTDFGVQDGGFIGAGVTGGSVLSAGAFDVLLNADIDAYQIVIDVRGKDGQLIIDVDNSQVPAGDYGAVTVTPEMLTAAGLDVQAGDVVNVVASFTGPIGSDGVGRLGVVRQPPNQPGGGGEQVTPTTPITATPDDGTGSVVSDLEFFQGAGPWVDSNDHVSNSVDGFAQPLSGNFIVRLRDETSDGAAPRAPGASVFFANSPDAAAITDHFADLVSAGNGFQFPFSNSNNGFLFYVQFVIGDLETGRKVSYGFDVTPNPGVNDVSNLTITPEMLPDPDNASQSIIDRSDITLQALSVGFNLDKHTPGVVILGLMKPAPPTPAGAQSNRLLRRAIPGVLNDAASVQVAIARAALRAVGATPAERRINAALARIGAAPLGEIDYSWQPPNQPAEKTASAADLTLGLGRLGAIGSIVFFTAFGMMPQALLALAGPLSLLGVALVAIIAEELGHYTIGYAKYRLGYISESPTIHLFDFVGFARSVRTAVQTRNIRAIKSPFRVENPEATWEDALVGPLTFMYVGALGFWAIGLTAYMPAWIVLGLLGVLNVEFIGSIVAAFKNIRAEHLEMVAAYEQAIAEEQLLMNGLADSPSDIVPAESSPAAGRPLAGAPAARREAPRAVPPPRGLENVPGFAPAVRLLRQELQRFRRASAGEAPERYRFPGVSLSQPRQTVAFVLAVGTLAADDAAFADEMLDNLGIAPTEATQPWAAQLAAVREAVQKALRARNSSNPADLTPVFEAMAEAGVSAPQRSLVLAYFVLRHRYDRGLDKAIGAVRDPIQKRDLAAALSNIRVSVEMFHEAVNDRSGITGTRNMSVRGYVQASRALRSAREILARAERIAGASLLPPENNMPNAAARTRTARRWSIAQTDSRVGRVLMQLASQFSMPRNATAREYVAPVVLRDLNRVLRLLTSSLGNTLETTGMNPNDQLILGRILSRSILIPQTGRRTTFIDWIASEFGDSMAEMEIYRRAVAAYEANRAALDEAAKRTPVPQEPARVRITEEASPEPATEPKSSPEIPAVEPVEEPSETLAAATVLTEGVAVRTSESNVLARLRAARGRTDSVIAETENARQNAGTVARIVARLSGSGVYRALRGGIGRFAREEGAQPVLAEVESTGPRAFFGNDVTRAIALAMTHASVIDRVFDALVKLGHQKLQEYGTMKPLVDMMPGSSEWARKRQLDQVSSGITSLVSKIAVVTNHLRQGLAPPFQPLIDALRPLIDEEDIAETIWAIIAPIRDASIDELNREATSRLQEVLSAIADVDTLGAIDFEDFEVELGDVMEESPDAPLAFVQSFPSGEKQRHVIRVSRASYERIRGQAGWLRAAALRAGVLLDEIEAENLALQRFFLHEIGHVVGVPEDALTQHGLGANAPSVPFVSLDGMIGVLQSAVETNAPIGQRARTEAVNAPATTRDLKQTRRGELEIIRADGQARKILSAYLKNPNDRASLQYNVAESPYVRVNSESLAITNNGVRRLQQDQIESSRSFMVSRNPGLEERRSASQVFEDEKVGEPESLGVFDQRSGFKSMADLRAAFRQKHPNRLQVMGVLQTAEEFNAMLEDYVEMLRREFGQNEDYRAALALTQDIAEGRVVLLTLSEAQSAAINAQTGRVDVSDLVDYFTAAAKAYVTAEKVVFVSDWRELYVSRALSVAVQTIVNLNMLMTIEGKLELHTIASVQA